MEKIVNYLIKEKKTTKMVADILCKALMKYDDIANEFIYWIDNRDFNIPNCLTIENYSAKDIHDLAPFLDATGIYGFMVTLRDNPQKAHEHIKNGFPNK